MVCGAGRRAPAVRAALRAHGRRAFRADLREPRAGVRAGRHQPQPGAGLRRHGELRPRALHGPGGVCRGHPGAARGGQRLGAARGHGAGLRGGGRHHRADLAAHHRHRLHHDHARLRADVLLPVREPQAIRRRRRPVDHRAQRLRAVHPGLAHHAVLRGPGAGAGRAVRHAAPGGRALRHGAARLPHQRAAHEGHGLHHAALQAHRLCAGKQHQRRGRAAVRQPHRLRLAGLHGLDSVGRADRDGGAGRHGHGVRPAARRAGAAVQRRGAEGHDRPLADGARPADRAGGADGAARGLGLPARLGRPPLPPCQPAGRRARRLAGVAAVEEAAP